MKYITEINGGMMIRHHKLMLILVVLLSMFACSKNKAEQAPEAQPSSEEISVNMAKHLDFPFNLWKNLNVEGQNLFISPTSINLAMGMAYTGARGNTATEIAKVMGYTESPKEEHTKFHQSLQVLEEIKSRKNAEFNIANALFNPEGNKDLLVPEYSEVLHKSFYSELFSLDFSQAQKTADFINLWVEKQTNNRIKNIVSERQIADSNDGLILVNSIYFKSDWLQQFPAENTIQERFYTSSQKDPDHHIILPMMKQQGSFPYAQTNDCKIVELPYVEREISMIFVIPNDMEKISAELDYELAQSWIEQLGRPERVMVFIPRFRIEDTYDKLVGNFHKLGINDAFNAVSADFSGILNQNSGQRLFISDIVHKTFLEVTETGTEAAAATQIGFAKTSLESPQPDLHVFRADQPFFCMILHRPTNEILFLGKIVKPQKTE